VTAANKYYLLTYLLTYITVTLMTSDKQSNVRRIDVKSQLKM